MVIILQDRLRGGGTERQAIAITEALERHGLNAELWVGWKGEILDEVAEKKLGNRLKYISESGKDSHFRVIFRLRQQMAKAGGPYDVLLLMGRWAHIITNFISPPDQPVIVSTVRTSRTLPWLYLRTIRKSGHLISNSQWALDRVNHKMTDIKKHFDQSVVHNSLCRDDLLKLQRSAPGADPDPEKAPVLLNVARLVPGKGHEELIRMMPLIEDQRAELWIAGEGPELERLEELCQRLKVVNRVHFTGFQEEIAQLYAQADIFVSASRLDSLPNAFIEAQAAALPVVAYDNFGIPEIVVDGQTGDLCRIHQPEELAHRVNKLITDHKRRLELGQAARDHARNKFDQKSQNDKFCRIIDNLTREKYV